MLKNEVFLFLSLKKKKKKAEEHLLRIRFSVFICHYLTYLFIFLFF